MSFVTLKDMAHVRVQKFLMEASDMARWQAGSVDSPQLSQFSWIPVWRGALTKHNQTLKTAKMVTLLVIVIYSTLSHKTSKYIYRPDKKERRGSDTWCTDSLNFGCQQTAGGTKQLYEIITCFVLNHSWHQTRVVAHGTFLWWFHFLKNTKSNVVVLAEALQPRVKLFMDRVINVVSEGYRVHPD